MHTVLVRILLVWLTCSSVDACLFGGVVLFLVFRCGQNLAENYTKTFNPASHIEMRSLLIMAFCLKETGY